MSTYQFIHLSYQEHIRDIAAEQLAEKAKKYFGINTGKVKSSKVYSIGYEMEPKTVKDFATLCLNDSIVNEMYVNELLPQSGFHSYIAIAKLPGVTDDEGISAQKALSDYLNINIDTNTQHIFSQDIYYIENSLPQADLKILAQELGNSLINHFDYSSSAVLNSENLYIPEVRVKADSTVTEIDLNIPNEALVQLSKTMLLALNLEEMKAIQAYYQSPETITFREQAGLPASPTDCELEILAQTWSEHCKHKEFNAIIHYFDADTQSSKTIHSLFKTFIKGATDKVAENLKSFNNHWLVKVFSDNAGVVKINDRLHFVWKVETHNSPSALDPYGGAITGILGNNRDPLGTGVGGAKLLFNTNVLCFGKPDFSGKLLSGQLHPKRIFNGVRHGIEDGGNKSGIPTVNGAIIFDERFGGKPLVYCGTGAIMEPFYHGKPAWEKPIDPEDIILMAGGRVGKDGIHGATFSSVEIDEYSPQSAVQIGSPITQKLLADFLVRACASGLVKCSTDNGAGGLSSSIGELATISNGAIIHLEKVPLKYSGLKPWEIFVSESQERMTIVVEKTKVRELFNLAQSMEVELSEIGVFTNSGNLEVKFNNETVALLDMHFLHEGVPQKTLVAEYKKPVLKEPALPEGINYNEVLLKLLGSFNICSREQVIRQYDHEVKGRTVLKPLMGPKGKAPQDAAVVRVAFDSLEGIAVSNGIIPHYGDIDAYQMSAGAFDEAVRQIISVGGSLPNTAPEDGIFWSVNDNFCVPDSVFDEQNNPDGKEKLAKLVQMCEALYDMATFFDIPLTSGKDSMKNDFKADGVKISVPPTILYSMAAKITDISNIVTSEFKAAGDLVYQLGHTYSELGASQFYSLFNELGANVPRVRKEEAKKLYQKVMLANNNRLIESSHDLSDGGLAVALAECAFGGNLGVQIVLDNYMGKGLSLNDLLFSESHSRFVVSVQPQNRILFEQMFGSQAHFLGQVIPQPYMTVIYEGREIINQPIHNLLDAWNNGLSMV
ncbi:MAG: phosphoribosylformylglycinamidine synthase [Sphingobacteriales bacterium]|nr:MAG: phosphoribosylformylglycinamidine synthase [Sphingobacteriales bacterium]